MAPRQTGPTTARLGQTLQFEDSFGEHSADITVARKKVSTGDEFDKPTRGYHVGLFVHVKAYQDGITVPQFYRRRRRRGSARLCVHRLAGPPGA